MAPKKKEVQKLSLGDFLNDSSFGGGGSWADEVEDTIGTQPLPPSDRPGRSGLTSYGGGGGSSYADRGYHSLRDNIPQTLPTKPPYTAHLGNLSYDATVETVTEFFDGCNIVNVRIIEDREQQRPKGFAYAEFEDVEGLKQALTLDGQNFQGRSIRIKIADPPKDRGDGREFRDVSTLDWGARRGPLEDLPGRGGSERRGDFGDRRGGGDFGDRRPPREPQHDDGKVRDFGNWERKGPLSPAAVPERTESRDGSRAPRMETRSESYRGTRRASPAAWGEGRQGGDGSRPPRREFAADRPERVPTAAEKDMQWRASMRPDAAAKSPGQSREGSEAPPSPAPAAVQPAGRPRLNLTKRTVSEAPAVLSPALSASDPKGNPFGAARPIDTATREREIEEKRVQALKEKKEADEKAKEERRLAKEAAAKEAAEKAEKAEAEAAAKAEAQAAEAEAPAQSAESQEAPASANGGSEQKLPVRSREPKEPKDTVSNPKSRAFETGNWRSSSGGSRSSPSIPSGPRRGSAPRGPRNDGGRAPRANGSGPGQQPQSPTTDQAPATPVDEDGWTTVATTKGRRGGRP
ncbi:hypothetical protein OQA88_549 [Cercophora sp. LCS_1]